MLEKSAVSRADVKPVVKFRVSKEHKHETVILHFLCNTILLHCSLLRQSKGGREGRKEERRGEGDRDQRKNVSIRSIRPCTMSKVLCLAHEN